MRSLIIAVVLATTITSATHAAPSACLRDLLSDACGDALDADRRLDNLRDDIDMDARARQDDRDFYDWFNRAYGPPGGRSYPRSTPQYNPYDYLLPPRRR